MLALVLLVGCKVYDPLYCGPDKECADPARPFCDLDGVYPDSDGVARTCIPMPTVVADASSSDGIDAGVSDPDASFCSAGAFVQCTGSDTAVYCNEQGSELVSVDCNSECDPDRGGCHCEPDTSRCANDRAFHCSGDGRVMEIEDCPLGCNDTGERCVDVNPSNGLAGYLDQSDDAAVVALSNGAIINTDDGTIIDGDGASIEVLRFEIVAPVGGVPLRVFAVKSITMGDTEIRGTRALAIVSDGDIEIRGHVLVNAGSVREGRCVGRQQVCDGPNTGGVVLCSGDGGGGFGTSGGDGGDGVAGAFRVDGGAGGSADGSVSLVPLRGGCPKIPGLSGGGGAIQLVSRTSILIEDGSGQAILDAGGSGGGSGGGILLEAPRVVVTSGTSVVACGAGGDNNSGTSGERGSPCSSTPRGAPPYLPYSPGMGGAGSDRTDRGGQDGQSISLPMLDFFYVASNGGGGSGRIRVNVPVPADYRAVGPVKPAASVGTLGTR